MGRKRTAAVDNETASLQAHVKQAPAPTPPISEAQMERDTRDTVEALREQPKRKIRLYQVPEDSADQPLPDEFVSVNGHAYVIKRGEVVEVPETVAEILEQAGRY